MVARLDQAGLVHFVIDQSVHHPDALEALVAGYERQWPDWYLGGKGSARDDLSARMREDGLPMGFVALLDGAPVGAAALTAAGPVRPDLGPWVSGLWTAPAHRRQGVAGALVRRCVQHAGETGVATVYAATADADALFRSLGWRRLENVRYPGGALTVYACAT